MGVLTVKVVKASNLRDEDFLGKTDPYVKISLEQDNFVSHREFLYLFFCAWNDYYAVSRVVPFRSMVHVIDDASIHSFVRSFDGLYSYLPTDHLTLFFLFFAISSATSTMASRRHLPRKAH